MDEHAGREPPPLVPQCHARPIIGTPRHQLRNRWRDRVHTGENHRDKDRHAGRRQDRSDQNAGRCRQQITAKAMKVAVQGADSASDLGNAGQDLADALLQLGIETGGRRESLPRGPLPPRSAGRWPAPRPVPGPRPERQRSARSQGDLGRAAWRQLDPDRILKQGIVQSIQADQRATSSRRSVRPLRACPGEPVEP